MFTNKQYRCSSCGYVVLIKTDHYHSVQVECPQCCGEHPMEIEQVFICLEQPAQIIQTDTLVRM